MTRTIVSLFAHMFGLTVVLYPRDFRRRLGSDMATTFEDECRRIVERHGAMALLRYGCRNVVVSVFAAMAERMKHLHTMVSLKADRVRGDGLLPTALRDARFALRSLLKAPAFTVTALLTLAIGIGATTAMFSIVNGVVLQPRPYPRAERLVRMYQQNAPTNRWALSVVDY